MSLDRDLSAVSRFSAEGAGISRLAWSGELRAAYDWLAGELGELGLEVELDPAGNLIGRWPAAGGESGSGAVLVGSHLDSVPNGGRFDGTLGVLSGLEAIRRLKGSGFEPDRPIHLIAFMDEEGSRFETTMFGSRAFCGEPLEEPESRRDGNGVSLAEAMRSFGVDPARAANARAIDGAAAYLELHIEQGPVLERAGLGLGVVDAISGCLTASVSFSGEAGHAGTTPMGERRDAVAAAAAAIDGIGRRFDGDAAGTVRATVGSIQASPGASNVIAGRCELSLDLRADDERELSRAVAAAGEIVAAAAAAHGSEHELEVQSRIEPVSLDPRLVATLEAAAAEAGQASMRMSSGAAHDAMVVGRHVPAAMLFVPSRNGISHNPAEFTAPEDCDRGAAVLAIALRDLAGQPGS